MKTQSIPRKFKNVTIHHKSGKLKPIIWDTHHQRQVEILFEDPKEKHKFLLNNPPGYRQGKLRRSGRIRQLVHIEYVNSFIGDVLNNFK